MSEKIQLLAEDSNQDCPTAHMSPGINPKTMKPGVVVRFEKKILWTFIDEDELATFIRNLTKQMSVAQHRKVNGYWDRLVEYNKALAAEDEEREPKGPTGMREMKHDDSRNDGGSGAEAERTEAPQA